MSLSILYVSAARRLGWSADVLDMPAHVRELVGHMAAPCPFDHVSRRSYAPAPKMRWASDLTYVATRSDFVYVTLVIDTYAKRIVDCGPAGQCMPAAFSTPWNKLYTTAGRPVSVTSSVITTASRNRESGRQHASRRCRLDRGEDDGGA